MLLAASSRDSSSPSITLPEAMPLSRVGQAGEAGLLIASLPWPRMPEEPLALAEAEAFTTSLGSWPGSSFPRRRLLAIDALSGEAPVSLQLTRQPKGRPWSSQPPRASLRLLAESGPDEIPWQQHSLEISFAGRCIGLAMGLRVGERVHWWEACRLEVLNESPECLTIEVGGAIPHKVLAPEAYTKGFSFELLHRHNWVNGRLYARLYANGVCEVFAHHINSRFFDDGLPLKGCVPVIGFRTGAPLSQTSVWDGSVNEVTWGDARIDLREVSRMATPEQPGRLWQEGEMTVLQPYLGCELYGGQPLLEQTGDPYILHAEDETMLRGMARTLRFSLSLSARSPRIVRYLPPAWWYGVCEELVPDSLLPAQRDDDPHFENTVAETLATLHPSGFEEGLLPRAVRQEKAGRLEPGWEGEMPYALFLTAWRTGRDEVYEAALRAAWYFTDVSIDHAAKMVRMHGWGPNAFSVPMNRAHACVAAWLETGVPYLLEAAEAITANAHFQQRNSWPRLAVGRDGCYIRSAVFLHRYTGSDLWLQYAREGCRHVTEAQRPDGAFGDQGGGAGIHQWAAYIVKPWMGVLALGGVLDYLELYPGDPVMERAVLRFANWLMIERREHHGVEGWSYQHGYRETRVFSHPVELTTQTLPTADHWHHDSLARVLAYATALTGDPSYLQAWKTSYEGIKEMPADHQISAHQQFAPWLFTRLACAKWDGDLQMTSALEELFPTWKFSIQTPVGTLPLCRDAAAT